MFDSRNQIHTLPVAAAIMDVENQDVIMEEVAENIVTDPVINSADNPDRHRLDFTSEIFKIELNYPGKFGYGEIKKLLKGKLGLKPTKIKNPPKPGGHSHAYLCFRNDEEKDEALKKLDGFTWKGKAFSAKVAKAVMDPLQKKRLENNGNVPTVTKTCLEVTAPLAHIPYADQIAQKEKDALDQLRRFGNVVKKVNSNLREKVESNQSQFDGLPCQWHGFKESPQINGYRNKNEFAIGKNADGEKIVGFRLSSYVGGSIQVGDVSDLPHVPERTKLTAKTYETYIRSSKYDVFNPEFYTGQFRQLTVRLSALTNEIMIIAGVHTTCLPDEDVAAVKSDIIEYFSKGNGKDLNVASIYFEEINKREAGQVRNRMTHIFGSEYITDSILGLKFRIGPVSFFQINTKAAEVLYTHAISLGNPTENTSVLDICCGIGTIGLSFAKHCKEVLGVELIAEAIEDAKFNAIENQIPNSQFFAGNCDDYIHTFIHQATGEDILAIIDPPRAGLHTKSIAAIRNARGLNRFVYISCSPKAAEKNWIDFARPSSKTLKGEPFIVTQAVAVDMFPHTDHKEMVLLFERYFQPKAAVVAPVVVAPVTVTPTVVAPAVVPLAVVTPTIVAPNVETTETLGEKVDASDPEIKSASHST